MNKSVVTTVSHYEYRDILLNYKYIRHSMHRLNVNTIEKEHTKSTKFNCLFLMAKYISKTMVMMDPLLVIIINYKISVILITI